MHRKRRFIVIHPHDNVATAIGPMKRGTEAVPPDSTGLGPVLLAADIPEGHKFALCRIPRGAPVKKYGEAIGRAGTDIHPGEHVHVHNVISRSEGPRP